ncbi:hypothetical protein BDZ97DRAFT_1939527 [Flammula alnicola]|nr:hypothetical protein BDZ97DRAFT_1939527 [Flammula alnicola]
MRECGTPDVPSFSALRKLQSKSVKEVRVYPEHHTSSLGNHFYMNHPLDSSLLLEKFKASHFYIKEVAQLKSGEFVVPMRWVIFQKTEHVDCYRMRQNEETGKYYLFGHSTDSELNALHRIPVIELKSNFLELRSAGYEFEFLVYSDLAMVGSTTLGITPHPVREIAKNRPAFVLRIMPWCDDVSGNRSKQYNPHVNLYMSNSSLPHQKLSQEYFVRFCSTSTHASSLEQFEALSQDIVCSCGGLACSLNCRYDKTGGSKEHKETDEGYHAMFEPGTPRTPEKTIAAIMEQIETACLGVQADVDALFTATGIKDKIAIHWNESLRGPEAVKEAIKLEIQQELKSWRYEKLPEDSASSWDHFNVLLRVRGLDPHKDSPCEILHTYLLGEDKYIWYDTSKKWDKKKEELFAICLQSSSLDGLAINSLRAHYCVQYKKSLIGKHFKALQQLAVFHLNDTLCPPDIFEIWKASGELGAMLWFPEIKNMSQYLSDLEILIANLLDLWAIYDPSRILLKFKLHVLSHLVNDIRRLGPAVLFSTEVFECWNAIFRLCSILSNHLAPSHDIAATISDMERFKHQVSGGWWKDSESEDWVRAGLMVRSYLTHTPELQRRLGWADSSSVIPGTAKLQSKKKQCPSTWKESLGKYWLQERDERGRSCATWVRCKYIVSRSHDICRDGSWPGAVTVGRIACILSPFTPTKVSQNPAVVIILELFEVQGQKDVRLNMPVLLATGRSILLAPTDILFIFNAQHDCRFGKCKIVDAPVLQERIVTTKTRGIVEHLDDTRHFINLHALHNAHLVRETLPRGLIQPQLRYPDRRKTHNELAASLRITGPAKRAATAAKTADTRARKKQQENDLGNRYSRSGGRK